MKVTYTSQHSFKKLEYDNDLENGIIKAVINDGEDIIEHDLSNYKPDDHDESNPPGFPIAGLPKLVDGELHVTLIRWYGHDETDD